VREEVAYGRAQLHLPDVDEKVARVLTNWACPGCRLASCHPQLWGAAVGDVAALAALETPSWSWMSLRSGSMGAGGAASVVAGAMPREGNHPCLVTHEMSLAAAADRVITLEAGASWMIYAGGASMSLALDLYVPGRSWCIAWTPG
jgi:hypothetical protein